MTLGWTGRLAVGQQRRLRTLGSLRFIKQEKKMLGLRSDNNQEIKAKQEISFIFLL